MNIKKDKFYGSDYSLKELRKIEKQLEGIAKKSHEAIEKQGDWRLKTTDQHQLYLESQKIGLSTKNKLDTIRSINMLQKMVNGKGATLKGTKELVKNREQAFIDKAVASGVGKRRAKEVAKSKDFYDFLHSDTYKKLSASVGKAGSPTITAEYMKHEKSALKYYEELVANRTNEASEISYKDLQVPKEFLT